MSSIDRLLIANRGEIAIRIHRACSDLGIRSIAIHGRTRVQMYKGSANWAPIAEVKNNPRMHIPVFGNGDVDTPEAAVRMRDEYGLDGAMIGRASIGNPWFFNQVKHYIATGAHMAPPNMGERVEAADRLAHSGGFAEGRPVAHAQEDELDRQPRAVRARDEVDAVERREAAEVLAEVPD